MSHPHLAQLEQVTQNWKSCLVCNHEEDGCSKCEEKNNQCAKQVMNMLHLHFETLLNKEKTGFKEGADIGQMEQIIDWIAHKVTDDQSEINELKQVLACDLASFQTQIMTNANRSSMGKMFIGNKVPELPIEDQMQHLSHKDDVEIDLGEEDTEDAEEEGDEGDEGDSLEDIEQDQVMSPIRD